MLLGLYSVLLAKFIYESIEDKISFFNVLAFIGIFNLITFWPLLIIFHMTGIETFELPKGVAIGYMTINIVFGTLLFDYCWGRATLLIGPLLANTSVILVVPISMLIDSFFIKTGFTWMYYVGTALILVGFFIIAFKNYLNSRKSKEELDENIKDTDFITEPLNNTFNEAES
mmetsp:Transcript_9664/g.10928  ORF Transcript_9664/g.10928 Transcript_9664/m.10928 type:complete len:172 (+) Transcript_9664:555-1070(+)